MGLGVVPMLLDQQVPQSENVHLRVLPGKRNTPPSANNAGISVFGFRTECIGFRVPTWYQTGQVEFRSQFVVSSTPRFVDGTLHEFARKVLWLQLVTGGVTDIENVNSIIARGWARR